MCAQYIFSFLVSASSKGVPEALQQCHETTRKLTTNQTILFGKTDDLNERLSNLTSQVIPNHI